LPLLFSLYCPFLIAPSVFSGLSILDCPFCFLSRLLFVGQHIIVNIIVDSTVVYRYDLVSGRIQLVWN
jgi:hypothetical protein